MKFLSWALEGAELLQPLLVMSLQGAVLIGAVLALRAVFARRMAPGVLYALWLLPAARLLIPGSSGRPWPRQSCRRPWCRRRWIFR